MSGALQMRANEKRANENCASSGIPNYKFVVLLHKIRPHIADVGVPSHPESIPASRLLSPFLIIIISKSGFVILSPCRTIQNVIQTQI